MEDLKRMFLLVQRIESKHVEKCYYFTENKPQGACNQGRP